MPIVLTQDEEEKNEEEIYEGKAFDFVEFEDDTPKKDKEKRTGARIINMDGLVELGPFKIFNCT